MIWNEARIGGEAAALLTSSLWRGHGVPRGAGRPVLLVPGFMAGDESLALMTQWLRRLGYRAHTSGITSNVECSERAVTRLEQRVRDLSARYDLPVSLIGHSRGGMFSRVIAVRQPDRVSHVITLASPLVATIDDFHPLLRLQIRALQRMQRLRPGAGLVAAGCERSWEAYHGGLEPVGCCTQFWSDLDETFPDAIEFTSIYSRSDGIIEWRCCLDPAAHHVEIGSSHCGMAFNPRVYRTIAHTLAGETWNVDDVPEEPAEAHDAEAVVAAAAF